MTATADSNAQVLERAKLWVAHDPDPDARAEIQQLIDEGDLHELSSRFAGPLEFGTAGLRAPVGAGESRMSRAVVIRTTFGLMEWLKEQVQNPVVVVGSDARRGSSQFHDDAARVISAAGGTALTLPKHNPTPLTAFSVKELGADAGIMITASHNPPADNGYKVYLGGRIASGAAEGVQLISPADKEIAAAIASAPFADEIAMNEEGISHVDTRAQYLDRASTLIRPENPGDVTIALTAMHGVGARLGHELLTRAGFTVSLVPEQSEPDPDFPTVPFPNPEEPRALTLAKSHATAINADVIIAFDPDADRCAVATPDAEADGGWRQLTGDETGALLGHALAQHGKEGTFANSVVSSRLLSRIAAAHGRKHVQTLTGFKWIARTPALAFGYEEALGYCCDPEAVADKDGISASLGVASLVAELKLQSKTLDDALADLARTHGLYRTQPLTFRVEDLSLISRGMQRLRENPPTQFAGAAITETIDLSKDELGIGATDGMYFITANNDRVICRPSGTEPKLKCYLEVVIPMAHNASKTELADANLTAQHRLEKIAGELQAHLQF